MDNAPPGPPSIYPEPVADADYLSVQQLAERLGCAPDDALALVRHLGLRGVIRTADRRFLVPTRDVEQLRAAMGGQQRGA